MMSPCDKRRHVHVRIEGRVQGVGFRLFVAQEATARGIIGMVRNRRDGGVELFASGELWAIDALITCVARGPRGAVVNMTKVFDVEARSIISNEFVIGATV